MTSIIEAKHIYKSFSRGRAKGLTKINALSDVSLSVNEGVNVGVIGESGSGKTTLGKIITKLSEPDSGNLFFYGEDITTAKERHLDKFRRSVQMIFQDPYSSLDPRMTVRASIQDFLRVQKIKSQDYDITKYLGMVELDQSVADKRPKDLSGGQRQRVAIAKALSLGPKLIVADEPVSALDVSIRSQILLMFENLKQATGKTFVYITHDISTIPFLADQVFVMYKGSVVESSTTKGLISEPLHPYSKGLIAAVPDFGKTSNDVDKHIKVDADPDAVPSRGCKFYFRCQYSMDICESVDPTLTKQGTGRFVACHLYSSSDETRSFQSKD